MDERSSSARSGCVCMRSTGSLLWAFFLLLLIFVGQQARADNISYAYDESGRLIQASNSTTGQAVVYS